jgi:hypothetical protein
MILQWISEWCLTTLALSLPTLVVAALWVAATVL